MRSWTDEEQRQKTSRWCIVSFRNYRDLTQREYGQIGRQPRCENMAWKESSRRPKGIATFAETHLSLKTGVGPLNRTDTGKLIMSYNATREAQRKRTTVFLPVPSAIDCDGTALVHLCKDCSCWA